MSEKHVRILESSMQRTQLWLKEIEQELHGASRVQAYAALRSVLHAIRDCLPVGEAVKFAAQMPLVVRGVYFDGWKPRPKPLRLTRHGFYDHIGRSLRTQPDIDYALAAQAVIRSLYSHLTAGELRRVRLVLSTEVRALWTEIERDLLLETPEAGPPPGRGERMTRKARGPGSRATSAPGISRKIAFPQRGDGPVPGGLGPQGDL